MTWLPPEIWREAGWLVLAQALPKGFILSALAVGVGLSLRRSSAATRAAWWTTSALALLTLPMLSYLLPVWGSGAVPTPDGWFDTTAGARSASVVSAGGISLAGTLVLIWLAGVAAFVGRFLLHLVRIAWITRSARPVAPERLAGLPRRALLGARVLESDRVAVPMTWGLVRPAILLPAASSGWSGGLTEAVIRHELAHVARRDYIGLVVLELCRALHWANPLAWLIWFRGRAEQERACDDAAMANAGPRAYAHHLVEIGRYLSAGAPAAALPFARRNSLLSRIESVLAPGISRAPARAGSLVLTGVLLAALAAPVAAVNLWICGELANPAPVVSGPALLYHGPDPAAPPVVEQVLAAGPEDVEAPARPAECPTPKSS